MGEDPAVGVEVDRLELPAAAHHHVAVFQVVDREPEAVDLLDPQGRAREKIHDVAQPRGRDKRRRFPVPPPGLAGAPAEGFQKFTAGLFLRRSPGFRAQDAGVFDPCDADQVVQSVPLDDLQDVVV